MSATIEKWALFRVYDLSQVLWLESKVDSYFPGNELFAKQITARYGLYNVNTGSEGPQLDTQSFTSTKAPPICPTAVPTVPAAPPAVPAVPPKAPADLDSTISICAQELKGQHIFDVKGGGLEIKLQAQGIGVKCSIPDYVVTLWKSNKYWIDGQMSRTKVPTGKQVKLTWRNLSYGQYYLHFKIGVHDSACCLKGGVSVRSFTTLRPGDIIA